MTHPHDDFELKRALDGLPRVIEPPGDDLWPGIRGRMDAQTHGRTGAQTGWRQLRMAALLTILAGSAGTLVIVRHNGGRWTLSSAALSARAFGVGDQFVSGSDSARLTVGTIGTVDVAAGTSVRLLEARWSGHRLALERGTLHAKISAPPRLFVVETPSGTAIDLGCAYTLAVDSAGNSSIVVTAGWVELSERGRTSLIPAGFRARTLKGGGVGTPVADDASAELVAAVQALDGYAMNNDSALAAILRTARRQDAVTLWHVLNGWRGSVAERDSVYRRLAAFVPPPTDSAVTRFAAVYGDPMTMRLWWQSLPGTLPIVPEWQSKLWKLYLRVFG